MDGVAPRAKNKMLQVIKLTTSIKGSVYVKETEVCMSNKRRHASINIRSMLHEQCVLA